MNKIITMIEALSPVLCSRAMNQLIFIVEATLAMTGRVTMLGIARWTEAGGSYRTVQRLFNEKLDWPKLRWLLNRGNKRMDWEIFFIYSGQSNTGLVFYQPIFD